MSTRKHRKFAFRNFVQSFPTFEKGLESCNGLHRSWDVAAYTRHTKIVFPLLWISIFAFFEIWKQPLEVWNNRLQHYIWVLLKRSYTFSLENKDMFWCEQSDWEWEFVRSNRSTSEKQSSLTFCPWCIFFDVNTLQVSLSKYEREHKTGAWKEGRFIRKRGVISDEESSEPVRFRNFYKNSNGPGESFSLKKTQFFGSGGNRCFPPQNFFQEKMFCQFPVNRKGVLVYFTPGKRWEVHTCVEIPKQKCFYSNN